MVSGLRTNRALRVISDIKMTNNIFLCLNSEEFKSESFNVLQPNCWPIPHHTQNSSVQIKRREQHIRRI